MKLDMMARDPTFDCTSSALEKVWRQGTGSGRFQDFLNGRQTGRQSVTIAQLRACTGSRSRCVCVCHRRYIDPDYTLNPAQLPEG